MDQVSVQMTTIPQTNGVADAATPQVDTPDASAPPEAEGNASVSPADASSAGATPEPEAEKHLELAKRFEGVSKREARARKLEMQVHEALSLVQKERDDFRKEREAFLAEREEWNADPVSFELKRGRDPVDAVKRFAKPESEEEKRIRKLEESLRERETREAERERQIQEAREAEAKYESMRGFVKEIVPEECPNLTGLYEAHEVPDLVTELLSRKTDQFSTDPRTGARRRLSMLEHFRMEHGRNPSNAEVRECLEYEAGLRARRIIEAHKASTQATPAPSPSEESESGPSSLSNQHAAVTSSGKSRPLSLDEKRAKARRELTVALEAEAAERRGA